LIDIFAGNEFNGMLPLAALYAETHYRFRFFPFSLYYRKQPEILFDTPLRLEPDEALPVFLMIKDAHLFPISAQKVTIIVRRGSHKITRQFMLNERVDRSFWFRIFHLDLKEFPAGELTVDASLEVISIANGRGSIVHNDNHPGLSHAPFKVHKAADPLPLLPGWSAGELHCHTSFGTDQVEFGAPLSVYQSAAKAMGHRWVALTDHAYNLDDFPEDYLTNDPEQVKWAAFLAEVEQANRDDPSVILLPGEELTCRSSTGRNIHLLLIGQRNLLIGTGDDAQDWFNTRSELNVSEALAKIDPHTAAIAAHPLTPISFLEKLLINREVWTTSDLNQDGLNGWQIWNGQLDEGFQRGMNLWQAALDQGKKIYIYAGNDAHGNFNRYRQIRLPMLSMREDSCHLFGRVTTRLKTGQSCSEAAIIKALQSGNSVVSNGPALDIRVNSKSSAAGIGNQINIDQSSEVVMEYITTPEFGKVKEIKLFCGGKFEEQKLTKFIPENEANIHPWTGKLAHHFVGKDYLRAELITEDKTGRLCHCFTNPIWLKSL